MKKILSIIIVCQMFFVFPVLSQTNTAQVKPATDACPTWNKKQGVSKAEYFAYLSKRSANKETNNFNVPKYQSYFTASNSNIKRQKQADAEIKHTEIIKTKAPVIIPEKENKALELPKENINKTTDNATGTVSDVDNEKLAVKEKKETVSSAKKADNKKSSNVVHIRKHLLKKISFRKKRANSCPEF